MCSAPDCAGEVAARGLCEKHYRRLMKTGTTDPSLRSRAPVAERLWRRVNLEGPFMTGMDSRCWEWEGHVITDGYGHIRVGKTMALTHRIAWEIANGPIPDGVLVCHRCDNPPCVRPDHLFLGDDAANAADRDEKGRLGPRVGEFNGNAKLSESDVVAIRQDPRPRKEIAYELRVSIATIDHIKTGRSWGHLA